jgi:hypothetical protein
MKRSLALSLAVTVQVGVVSPAMAGTLQEFFAKWIGYEMKDVAADRLAKSASTFSGLSDDEFGYLTQLVQENWQGNVIDVSSLSAEQRAALGEARFSYGKNCGKFQLKQLTKDMLPPPAPNVPDAEIICTYLHNALVIAKMAI